MSSSVRRSFKEGDGTTPSLIYRYSSTLWTTPMSVSSMTQVISFVFHDCAFASLRFRKASRSSREMTNLRPSLMARSSRDQIASRIAQIAHAVRRCLRN